MCCAYNRCIDRGVNTAGHIKWSIPRTNDAEERPAGGSLTAFPQGKPAIPDTSKTRFHEWQASANWRHRQSSQTTEDLEIKFLMACLSSFYINIFGPR